MVANIRKEHMEGYRRMEEALS